MWDCGASSIRQLISWWTGTVDNELIELLLSQCTSDTSIGHQQLKLITEGREEESWPGLLLICEPLVIVCVTERNHENVKLLWAVFTLRWGLSSRGRLSDHKKKLESRFSSIFKSESFSNDFPELTHDSVTWRETEPSEFGYFSTWS